MYNLRLINFLPWLLYYYNNMRWGLSHRKVHAESGKRCDSKSLSPNAVYPYKIMKIVCATILCQKKKMRKFFAFSHNCGPGWWWIICKGEGKGDRVEGGRERGERKRKKEREGWYIVEREASSCSTRTSDDYGSVVWCGAVRVRVDILPNTWTRWLDVKKRWL